MQFMLMVVVNINWLGVQYSVFFLLQVYQSFDHMRDAHHFKTYTKPLGCSGSKTISIIAVIISIIITRIIHSYTNTKKSPYTTHLNSVGVAPRSKMWAYMIYSVNWLIIGFHHFTHSHNIVHDDWCVIVCLCAPRRWMTSLFTLDFGRKHFLLFHPPPINGKICAQYGATIYVYKDLRITWMHICVNYIL